MCKSGIAASVFLFLLTCSGPVSRVYAGAISGTVTDTTGTPLSYATVLVDRLGKGAFTARDGTFLLTDVPAGVYTVRARLMGYSPDSVVAVRIESGDTTRVNLKLVEKSIRLRSLVTVGVLKQKPLDRITPPQGGKAEDSLASAVHDFVGKLYVHGVPYGQAHQLGRGALPVLREILADSLEAEHWDTACATIGSIGEAEGFPILRDFIWHRFKGKVDEKTLRALRSAQQCIGLLAADSPAAIAYLSQGADPDFWAAPPWSSPRHTQEKLDLLFARLSISGLGFVDNLGARTELARVRDQEVRPILRREAEAALAASDSVKARGLPSYMKRLRERLGSE